MQKQTMYVKGAPASAPFLEILIADTFLTRFAGLMFRKKLPSATGLYLAPCNSVHMCFMRFAIDVVYLDKEHNIIKIHQNTKKPSLKATAPAAAVPMVVYAKAAPWPWFRCPTG